MPFYEYRCPKCGNEFEALVPTMRSPAPRCARCGSHVRKKPSVFGVGTSPAREAVPPRCGGCAQSGSCPMAR